MQSGAGSEPWELHSHLPGSQRYLLVAWAVPRAQYGGQGRREGPEGMKEDPHKVKQTLQSHVAPFPASAS